MRLFLILITLLSFLACQELPKLSGFDKDKWTADTDGCEENRLKQIDTLMAQSAKLKGLSQNEMRKLLGKADKHELYERSQKFFIYNLQKGNKCDAYDGDYYKALYIRFNSLDQAVAFTIQEVK